MCAQRGSQTPCSMRVCSITSAAPGFNDTSNPPAILNPSARRASSLITCLSTGSIQTTPTSFATKLSSRVCGLNPGRGRKSKTLVSRPPNNSRRADQLLHRLAIGQWINFVDLHGLLLQFALVGDLAISLSLLERILGDAVLEFVLVLLDLAHQRDNVEPFARAGRIEDLVVDAGIESDTLQQQGQLAGAFDVHANAMRFLNAVDGAVVVKDHVGLLHVTGDLRDESGLHAEVVLETRAAASRELDDVRGF